jgi:hypothetical protein
MNMKFNRPFHFFTHLLIKTVNPTPTLTLPLKGREIITLFPFQGGGWEGDGVSVIPPMEIICYKAI